MSADLVILTADELIALDVDMWRQLRRAPERRRSRP